jgi:putative SOS response-associated peptidase YedK
VPSSKFFEANRCQVRHPAHLEQHICPVNRTAGFSVVMVYRVGPERGGPVCGHHAMLNLADLTCAPNEAMAEIHNRMPVILDEKNWSKWLGEEPATEQEFLALLRPCPDEWLKIWPVDNKVGNVRNTGAELKLPIELPG